MTSKHMRTLADRTPFGRTCCCCSACRSGERRPGEPEVDCCSLRLYSLIETAWRAAAAAPEAEGTPFTCARACGCEEDLVFDEPAVATTESLSLTPRGCCPPNSTETRSLALAICAAASRAAMSASTCKQKSHVQCIKVKSLAA